MEKLSFIWTIIFGLIVGIGANILTPYIRRLLGRLFVSVQHRNERRKENFNKSVQYLIEHPNDETHIRIESMAYFLAALITMLTALILAFISTAILEKGVTLGITVISLHFLKVYLRKSGLASASWEQRKETDVDIAID